MNLIICGDALTELRKLPDESVNCCVTSPPYWGLRDYGVPGQFGLEHTPEEYVAKMVEIFREVRRALKIDGTLWLNLGDCYHSGDRGGYHRARAGVKKNLGHSGNYNDFVGAPNRRRQTGLKDKDLVGIPWRVAFALQADGWWLRQDIIWAKPNPMPESVRDRCTKAHEYIFMLSKSSRYWYDAEAVKEPMADCTFWRLTQPGFEEQTGGPKDPGEGNRSHRKTLNNQHEKLIRQEKWKSRFEGYEEWKKTNGGRNLRSVWPISTKPFPEAHFATFPPEIPERCIKAGCPKGGTVLDPFFGAGTTGLVAMRLGREFIGIELNPSYCEMAKKRIFGPLIAEIEKGLTSR